MTSTYVGAGRLAELAAQLDAHERAEREAEGRALRKVMQDAGAIDERLDELRGLVDEFVTAALVVTGHHQHKRQWRKQRGNKSQSERLTRVAGNPETYKHEGPGARGSQGAPCLSERGVDSG